MSTSVTPFLKYSFTFGISTMRGRGFYYPTDAVFGKNGLIYVPNRSVPVVEEGIRICICDVEGGFYGIFGFRGNGDGQFMWPSSGAMDSNGLLYFSDEYTHRISIFDAEGEFVSKWGIHGAKNGNLDTPSSITFDKHDDLYVSDTYNNRIQKFTKDGQFIKNFGSEGDGDGQFTLPWGITIDTFGDVYVADWGNNRIQKFSADGDFLTSYGTPGQGNGEFYRPSGVTVDGDGYIYIADWGNNRVQVLDPEGEFVINLRGEATLSAWAKEFMLANKEESNARNKANLEPEIHFFEDTSYEESSHIEKYFWAPISVKLDDAGKLYVIDSNRHRIQVYERTI